MPRNNEEASTSKSKYKPAPQHWFYKRNVGSKFGWVPFSFKDSARLEANFSAIADGKRPSLVPVHGGRYDVDIPERIKTPVYWDGLPVDVRRCSWFYKTGDGQYVPYIEEMAKMLENEYKKTLESGVWNKRVQLSKREYVILYGPTLIVYVEPYADLDSWGGSSNSSSQPRQVRRDLTDFNIEEGETDRVDHLIFMVHGIGAACDLKFRSLQEVVGSFRSVVHKLLRSHYKHATKTGQIGRIEVLPISWHEDLHSVELGLDEKLTAITLKSIPKLRNFTNDTLLDILFYTSPTYCQKITSTVTQALNDSYEKYCSRQPDFRGSVSVAGHSLGSVILFDILANQKPEEKRKAHQSDTSVLSGRYWSTVPSTPNTVKVEAPYARGPAGTGQPYVNYTKLAFQPKSFFALGSPIAIFVTIRGIDRLGVDFCFPTCPSFFNIFHPFDPVAYRVESLISPGLSNVRPVLIPHHKGRKRMHLEIRDTMTRLSTELKARFIKTLKNTLNTVRRLSTRNTTHQETATVASSGTTRTTMTSTSEEEETNSQELQEETDSDTSSIEHSTQNSDYTLPSIDDLQEYGGDLPLGKLNNYQRIDYVLQEAPLEFFNEYIFALSSHVCYWDSEDTALLILKQVYKGIKTDSEIVEAQIEASVERMLAPSTFDSDIDLDSRPMTSAAARAVEEARRARQQQHPQTTTMVEQNESTNEEETDTSSEHEEERISSTHTSDFNF
ncbi:phospholipase DDHD2-like [Teleopsis dalmanni]|uniref:phospholipase DDHD2-like n=1 Tax=Teleopsis dalmanni TaxID=139649 RepID=UPI0018CD56E5|nr:phospholipase DDHD2-like [Teleopsis dalmanni]XP_037927765.1 phospholipase DDHD2-like [Teleopsis dalmanni]